jgi:DNA mismatch repair ATPase MutS
MHTGYSNRCSILTGPNASGKTVYMKQIALAIYLAHVGFFVPASLAEIPLTDSILFVGKAASIYNEQSCGFHSELASLSSLTQPCKDVIMKMSSVIKVWSSSMN